MSSKMLKRLALIGVTVGLLAGCGGSSSSSQTVSLTRAAYVSGRAAGYKARIAVQEQIPNVGQMTMTGSGSFSLRSRAGSMTMQMNIPSAQAAAAGFGNLQIQAVMVPGAFYIKMPAAITSKIPGSKPWWQINLNQIGKLAGIPGLSSLMSGTSSMNDPGQYLDFLRATANGSVKNLGQATVDGVRTTHYRAAIDFTKLPNAVPANDRQAVDQMLSALRSDGALAHHVPVDAWIDSSNLIRRFEMTYSVPVGGGAPVTATIRSDYVDYGPQPAPQIPPKNQTLNLLALMQHAGL